MSVVIVGRSGTRSHPPVHSAISGRLAGASEATGKARSIGQNTVELAARLDTELGEHLAQVVLDCPCADEQTGTDLWIGQAVARHARNLSLLRRELLIGTGHRAFAGRFTRGADLPPGPLRESLHPHRLQHFVGDAKLCSRVDAATLPAQPFAVQEVRASEVCSHMGTAKTVDRLAVETFSGVAVTEQRT